MGIAAESVNMRTDRDTMKTWQHVICHALLKDHVSLSINSTPLGPLVVDVDEEVLSLT